MNRNSVIQKCSECGVAFSIARSIVRDGGGKFCAMSCRAAWDARRKDDPRAIAERFWRKVDKHGPVPTRRPELGSCWVWCLSTRSGGYGQFRIGKRSVGAHRFAYELLRGPIGDLMVCHHCDNPPCCNPAHLFLGTRADNAHDMAVKGRSGRYTKPERTAYGERFPQAKLTHRGVQLMVARRANGVTYHQLASEFGVHHSTVARVMQGKSRWLSLAKAEPQELRR